MMNIIFWKCKISAQFVKTITLFKWRLDGKIHVVANCDLCFF